MSGNVKLACTLVDYNKISKDLFETNIRGAHLYPLSSQLFQKSVKVSLLNSSYEYDLKRFYSAYSDTFYSPCFEYDKKDIKMLDRTSVVYTRNTDFEYGVKRISYQKSGCQFACFAPIYIDNVDDIPSYFLITVTIKGSKMTVKKQIRVNIGINGSSDYNYIYKYLKKYLSNIDDNVIYMDNTDKSLTYYGIDCVNGGFTRTTDATVKNLFDIHMPIQMFDRTISIGFERNNMVIRQVIPFAFYFNIQDIFTDSERVKFRYADMTFSGAYYDKDGNELKWYDFDWDYTKFSNDIYTMNPLNGIMQKSAGYTSNIMAVGFPSLSDKYLTQYQFANKLTTTFAKWKLKYSSDEWPYITNMSWAYSNNQDSTYKYREFPVTYTNQAAYVIIDSSNKYNLRFPLGPDIDLYNQFNPRSAKKYEAIMNNYCLNWFDLYYPENRTDNINESIIRDKDSIDWVDVNNGYSYYRGVLYNFNLIYDKVSQFNEADKIDKFAVIVHPDTMNIIHDDNKGSITFTSLSILTKELNNTEQILNNCIFNKSIIENVGNTTDEYIPLFDIYDNKRTDNLMFNEIFDVVDNDKIDEVFVDDNPIYINSADILLDIYKSNSVIKPSENGGIYKLSTLKDIKGVKRIKTFTEQVFDEYNEPVLDENGNPTYENVQREVVETYFGANFINALITLFNTYETVSNGKIVKDTINKITIVPDDVLFNNYVPEQDYEHQDCVVYNYYKKIDSYTGTTISAADLSNLEKIAKRLFYSDSKGRTVLNLISDVFDASVNNKTGFNNAVTSKEILVDLMHSDLRNGSKNMFRNYAYFASGPEGYDISNSPDVMTAHGNEKIFNNDPVLLLLGIAHVVSEAMKMYQTDDTFDSCFPVIFTDFGYEMWELLPIFRGKLFTNIDGKLLTSLEEAIRKYNDVDNVQYDHNIKDIYINYNKYHSFNPEKLIYKSGETIVINDIKYQELLNNTYEHTLYYRSKFIDDTFLEKEAFNVNNKFFGPLCLTSEVFPLGDISASGTGTCAIYHGLNRIINLIKISLSDMINNTSLDERFFYYPVKYYNRYNCGSQIAYKINKNWNEYSNNVVYDDAIDKNVLYVHPYNFTKIMYNAELEANTEIIINAFGELDDVYSIDTNTNTITTTTHYYTGASVNSNGDIVLDGSDIQYEKRIDEDTTELVNLNNSEHVISTDYDGTADKTKIFETVDKYVKAENSVVIDELQRQAFKKTVYEQKVTEGQILEPIFNIEESDKVEMFAKVYNADHLNILANMKDSDFECINYKEIVNKDTGEKEYKQVIEKIGNGGENRFYEQHKRMIIDSNTGYIKVKYEYIPIDFNKKYIIPELNIDAEELNSLYTALTELNAELTKESITDSERDILNSKIEEIYEALSKYYSIISYKSMIIYDNTVGMFKKYKVCDEHINDYQHNTILDSLMYNTSINQDGSLNYIKIYDHASHSIPADSFEHVEVVNNTYVYEYFNIVEKNTFIKINNDIMDYININNPAEYKDMYIYRPILDMEYDEKYSIMSKAEAVIKDLSIANDNITDTSTMLYPCFNTIYKQDLDTALIQLNIAVDNIREVKLYKPSVLPSTSRQTFSLNTVEPSNTYYRYVLKDNALFISVSREEYDELCNKLITFNSIEYKTDENGNYILDETGNKIPNYKYLVWNREVGGVIEELPDNLKEPYKVYELIDGPFYNYESTNESPTLTIDPKEYNAFYIVTETADGLGHVERRNDTGKGYTNGLRYYIKGNPVYETSSSQKQIPLKFSKVYNRRYIPNPIYLSVDSDVNTYKDNMLNTFRKDGLVYGYYLINAIVDNSSNTLNIRAMLDTNTSVASYSDVDNISNINYVSIINDNDITSEDGLKYYLYVFRQLCPFMYNNITATMLSINTIMQPETFNITNTYSTTKTNTINGSDELDLVFNKHTIMTAKKQILQRYTNSIVPYIYECVNIDNLYTLKLKECNATLLNTGNYFSIGDSVLHKRSQNINTYYPAELFGVSENSKNSYNNIVGTYTPLEYKYYNTSKMLNLETYIENTSTKRYTYAELIEAESEKETLNVFSKYLKRMGLSLTNDEILFLYNKYEKKYETKFISMSIDNSQKLYTLTYKFNLL
jgi:hypothetical protein